MLKKEYMFLLLTVFPLVAIEPVDSLLSSQESVEKKEEKSNKKLRSMFFDLPYPFSAALIGTGVGSFFGYWVGADNSTQKGAAFGAFVGCLVGCLSGFGSYCMQGQRNQYKLQKDFNNDTREIFSVYYNKLSDSEKDKVPYVLVKYLVRKNLISK